MNLDWCAPIQNHEYISEKFYEVLQRLGVLRWLKAITLNTSKTLAASKLEQLDNGYAPLCTENQDSVEHGRRGRRGI